MNTEKYSQLFTYLLEFSKLKAKISYDILTSEANYPNIFWLKDFLDNNLISICTQNCSTGTVLTIQKPSSLPKYPEKPTIPSKLEFWVQESFTSTIPSIALKQSISVNDNLLTIEDHPEIQTIYNQFYSEKFEPYIKKYELYTKELDIYDQAIVFYKSLFKLFHTLQQHSEDYELILGTYFLSYKKEEIVVRKHLITQPVTILLNLNDKNSNITIAFSNETISLESDSLYQLNGFISSDTISKAEEKLRNYLNTSESLENCLDVNLNKEIKEFLDYLTPDGILVDTLEPGFLSSKLEISYAPCLLLRKRNTGSLVKLYETILDNINTLDGKSITQVDDIIGFSEKPLDTKIDFQKKIYFTKEYNDDQLEIIQRAEISNKVVVQGPPGTGKSHTITNLIGHLLAQGNKILVTSYSTRALEVLKNKLPESFQNLAVQLLGSDSSSDKDLVASVNAIYTEVDNSNIKTIEQEIVSLEKDYEKLSSIINEKEQSLFKLKENSFQVHDINPYYKGNTAQIAEKIFENNVHSFNLKDSIKPNYNHSEIIHTVNTYITNQEFLNQHAINLNETLPSVRNVITESFFENYVNTKQKNIEFGSPISIKSLNIAELLKLVTELHGLYQEIELINWNNKDKVLNNIEFNQDKLNSWNTLNQHFKDSEIKEILNTPVKLPIHDTNALTHHCKTLLEYVNQGNVLSGLAFSLKKNFLPNTIKQALYLTEVPIINGRTCVTGQDFKWLINYLKINSTIQSIASELLSNTTDNTYKSYLELKDNMQNLEFLNSLILPCNNLKAKIQQNANIKIFTWDVNEIATLKNAIENKIQQNEIALLELGVNETQDYLNSIQNPSNLVTNLIQSIQNLDNLSYSKTLSQVQELESIEKTQKEQMQLLSSIKHALPNLGEDLLNNTIKLSTLQNFELSYYTKQASEYINNSQTSEKEVTLLNQIHTHKQAQNQTLSNIAAKKAWWHVIAEFNSKPELRQHLTAWVDAVQRIGKNANGKRSLKFRKIAQQEMEFCKTAIPCWIMPMYKLAETLNPTPEIYDYIIIDEASQIGPEALFLTYITKNIIIVGDDKQTSPEYIGIDSDTVKALIEKNLKDFPFKQYYGLDFSLFDWAKIFSNGNIVTLREHYRCMPEIIEFCNKHFYAPTGKSLFALKQYKEDRLEPLKATYCEFGLTEGNQTNIFNQKEAIEIANTIKELVQNPEYKNKTFGVIALQGTKQAQIIEGLILKAIGEEEFYKRELICGTSTSFQGDERDIMFLSLVTAPNHNRIAFTKTEDERRFNVAVSRAKEQVWLFHSVRQNDLSNPEDLRYKLLDHFENYKIEYKPLNQVINYDGTSLPNNFKSSLALGLFNDLVAKGIALIPSYKIANGKYVLDLVSIGLEGKKVAINCNTNAYNLIDYKKIISDKRTLERCGWKVLEVEASDYYINKTKVVEKILLELN